MRRLRPDPLLVGAYGNGNIGDEAILAGLLQEIGDRRNALVFATVPTETEKLHGVRARRRALFPLLRSKRIWVGGGELFQPGMAWKYATLILIARLAGRPVEVRAVGVNEKLRGGERT